MKYGRYEILKELGKGAMGVVYQAHDPNIDRDIALKVLRPDRVSSADFVQRFLKEARAIGRMSHRNIVTVYDVGEDQETVFIAMEYLEGVPLNVYNREHAMSMEEIAEIGMQMADSLNYAHTRGIVHRDIKPQNIMIAPGGMVKITDFGIAHIEDPEASYQTQAGEILGTPNYMSPEQVMGGKVDGRSDLFSLGVILYELATGTRPFKGDNLAAIFHDITTGTPDKPGEVNPDVSPYLSGLIMKCLQKEPEARFQNGQEIVDALKAFLKAREPSAVLPEPDDRKSPVVLIAVVVAVLIAIIAGGIFFTVGKKEPSLEKAGSTETVKQADIGTLKVESTPEGAQLFVDGSLKGKTPLGIQVAAGSHEVRLSMPEYYEWEAQVQVEKDGEQPLSIQLIKIE